MRKFSFHKSPNIVFGLFLFPALFAFSVFVLQPKRERPRLPFLSPPQITHFSFGFREQAADSLWLRALQDFDFCEKEVAKQVCASSGWLSKMLDVITDLAPTFRMPFAIGPMSLTILVNDFAGASLIFDKAVKAFPNDWPILSRAGYHALYEEKDDQKAAELLRKAARAGGPPWYNMLAARLSLKTGRKEFTQAMIFELENSPNPDPVLLKTLRTRLEEAIEKEKASE